MLGIEPRELVSASRSLVDVQTELSLSSDA
jgi:hypothetical protein